MTVTMLAVQNTNLAKILLQTEEREKKVLAKMGMLKIYMVFLKIKTVVTYNC